MAIGFVLITVLLDTTPVPARKVSLGAPLKALAHPGLRSLALVAVLYNFGFFTVLAYTPFPMGLGTHELGLVFFGWGLLLALTSVFGAQRLERRFGLVVVLTGSLLGVAALMGLSGGVVGSPAALAALVVVSGGLFGIVNTELTEAVMAAAVVERPVASAAYSFVRFTGGAIAPFLAGKLGEHVSAGAPLYAGAVMVAGSAVALAMSRRHLRHGGAEEGEVAPGALGGAVPSGRTGRHRGARRARPVQPAGGRVVARGVSRDGARC
jgi:predicted MFS family arabinose efflux permease